MQGNMDLRGDHDPGALVGLIVGYATQKHGS